MKIFNYLKNTSENTLWVIVFFLTLLLAWFSEGFHHFDEHFQIIEFMNFKLGGTSTSELPWEYHKRIRPWFQPYLFLILDTPFRLLDASPFFRAFILRLWCGSLALLSLLIFRKKVLPLFFSESSKLREALIFILFTWYVLYINVRASSEALSLSLFILGLAQVIPKAKPKFYFLGGIFCGLSYLTRFQMGLPVATLWFWGLLKGNWKIKESSLFALAIIICFALGFAIDSAGYGESTFPLWNYFKANFLDGVLDHMGISPWYKYLEWVIIKPIPPISLILLWGTLLFWKKHFRDHLSWLTWITASFFIFHTLIGHKELRFIFLCGYFAPLMTYYVYRRPPHKSIIWLNIILIFVAMKPANRMLPLYKFLYNSEIKELYFVEENPKTLVGLPLNFYFRDNLLIRKLGQQSPHGKYVFTKRFLATSQYLENKGCKPHYLNYPKFIFEIEQLRKVFRNSKAMGVFHCPKG